MDALQEHEYTVEYQAGYGVTYFDIVVACSIADAKGQNSEQASRRQHSSYHNEPHY